MKLLRFILYVLAWIAAALCAAWAFGALYFDFPKASAFAAILFVIACETNVQASHQSSDLVSPSES